MWRACIFTPKTVNLILCLLGGWCDKAVLHEGQLTGAEGLGERAQRGPV